MQFVLASESPRRTDLLRQAGYSFEVRSSNFPEVTLEDPKETVLANAQGKALAVSDSANVVLAADTVVYLPGPTGEGQILGKAENKKDVQRMLELLRGKSQEVHSGVAVFREGELLEGHALTRVRMRRISDAEVEAYSASEEGVGKAGGYAIQGQAAIFVEWIGGDYTNVVGLPLSLTCRLLDLAGVRWY